MLREQTGNPDITFMDVYERYGKELCIVTTNLDYMTEEYLHPKTTPSMPIREAVRLSISIPSEFCLYPFMILNFFQSFFSRRRDVNTEKLIITQMEVSYAIILFMHSTVSLEIYTRNKILDLLLF